MKFPDNGPYKLTGPEITGTFEKRAPDRERIDGLNRSRVNHLEPVPCEHSLKVKLFIKKIAATKWSCNVVDGVVQGIVGFVTTVDK